MGGESYSENLAMKILELAKQVKALAAGILDAEKSVQELMAELQRASEDRVSQNSEFGQTVTDQAGKDKREVSRTSLRR